MNHFGSQTHALFRFFDDVTFKIFKRKLLSTTNLPHAVTSGAGMISMQHIFERCSPQYVSPLLDHSHVLKFNIFLFLHIVANFCLFNLIRGKNETFEPACTWMKNGPGACVILFIRILVVFV